MNRQIAGQTTIFDFLPKEEICIEDMTSQELAEKIGSIIGISFVKSGWKDEFIAKPKKKLEMTIKKSHYACDTYNRKEGDAFISCGYSYGNGGCGSPIDSIDDAIKFFRRFMNEYNIG